MKRVQCPRSVEGSRQQDEIRLGEFLSPPEQAHGDKEISLGKKRTPEFRQPIECGTVAIRATEKTRTAKSVVRATCFTENLWSIRIQPQQRLEFKPRQYAGWRRAQLCGPQARMKSCRPIAPQKLGAAIGAATQELQSAYLLCKVGFGDDDPKRVARTAAFVVRVFSAP